MRYTDRSDDGYGDVARYIRDQLHTLVSKDDGEGVHVRYVSNGQYIDTTDHAVSTDAWDVQLHPHPAGNYSTLLPYSIELLMDEGVIPDTRTPVQLTRSQRVNIWLAARSQRLRERLASWIVGYDITDV